LASASPRRRELLDQLGIVFLVVPGNHPEKIADDLGPLENIRSIALSKARLVANKIDSGLVLAADTAVVIDGRLFGKPENRDHARKMLSVLSGRTHVVYTALALLDVESDGLLQSSVESSVTMCHLRKEEINAYVATGEPMDRAGSYAAQERGTMLIETVHGCFNNVVGLPICEVRKLLLAAKFMRDEKGGRCMLPNGNLCPREET
jgi:nucleoside triphosphate pyrophosphatase